MTENEIGTRVIEAIAVRELGRDCLRLYTRWYWLTSWATC